MWVRNGKSCIERNSVTKRLWIWNARGKNNYEFGNANILNYYDLRGYKCSWYSVKSTLVEVEFNTQDSNTQNYINLVRINLWYNYFLFETKQKRYLMNIPSVNVESLCW